SVCARQFVFGDYGIVHPEKPEIDPKIMRATAKIRYTMEDCWLVIKGEGLHKGDRYKQYFSLAEILASDPIFEGPDFSWGDDHVVNCSNRNTTTGNPTTWVKVDTNHHITFVVRQLNRILGL
ncbi:MAG: hypothetical protein EOO88_28965, partial [Pedobacter sp.]